MTEYFLKGFRIGEPKSKAGYRTIPMTQTAYDILKAKEKERHTIKVLDFRYKDFVFINRHWAVLRFLVS